MIRRPQRAAKYCSVNIPNYNTAVKQPQSVWTLLFIGTLTYGTSLLFSSQIAAYRQWAMAGPLLAVLAGLLAHPRSFDVYKLPYWIFPGDSGLGWLSGFAVAVGLAAAAATYWMAKKRAVGFHVWLVLVMFGLQALGYVVAEFGRWGMPLYSGPRDSDAIFPILRAISYLIAYVAARIGLDFEGAQSPAKHLGGKVPHERRKR